MPNLLFELGVEELPSGCLDVVYGELRKKAGALLTKNRLTFQEIKAEATPRRITLFIEGLGERQADHVLEFSGPSVDKAYDTGGKSTQALQGFLKNKHAAEKDIVVKDTPRGKFITLQIKEKGRPAKAVLPNLLSEIVLSLPFPKNMRWEAGGFKFPRPIRWLVVLLDKTVLPVKIAGLKSGKVSRGHRFLSTKPFLIAAADWALYRKMLKKNHVWISLEERVQWIEHGLADRFKQSHLDQELVHITAQLVEEPFLLDGAFSKTYLDLPGEVLSTCLKKHQKIFALTDNRVRPLGRFVAVLNGSRRGLPKVRADFQNVLESRLKDARYFYAADTKEPFESKLPLLDQIVYLDQLGSLRDKTQRLENLAESFAGFAGKPELAADLKRTARLAKIDLMTHLVYEFPDLQGICGREYALASDEKEAVARAIGEQYLPKNLADSPVEVQKQISPLGALYGLLDRFDLLTGAFGSGMEPSGSQDPYALRRAGGIIVKFVRAFGYPLLFKKTLTAFAQEYGSRLEVSQKDFQPALLKFFKDRMVFELGLNVGTCEAEIFDAVWKAGAEDFLNVFKRFEALTAFYHKEKEAFWNAAKVVERTGNIAKSAAAGVKIKPELLIEVLEKELGQLYQSRGGEVTQALQISDYAKATRLYGQIFHDPLDAFFKQVMVNVEDSAVRANRQALLRHIYDLYAGDAADLSVLSRTGQE